MVAATAGSRPRARRSLPTISAASAIADNPSVHQRSGIASVSATSAAIAIGIGSNARRDSRVIRDPDGTLRPQRTPRTLRKTALWAAVAAGTALSLVVSGSIAAGTFVLGSSSGGWVHDYLYPFQFRSIAIFAIVFAGCAVLAMVPLAEVNRRQWRMLAMWFALGLCAQGVLRGLSPYTMDGLV